MEFSKEGQMLRRSMVLVASAVMGFSTANACTEGPQHDGIVPRNSLRITSKVIEVQFYLYQ